MTVRRYHEVLIQASVISNLSLIQLYLLNILIPIAKQVSTGCYNLLPETHLKQDAEYA